jgi:hypothetical protein
MHCCFWENRRRLAQGQPATSDLFGNILAAVPREDYGLVKGGAAPISEGDIQGGVSIRLSLASTVLCYPITFIIGGKLLICKD